MAHDDDERRAALVGRVRRAQDGDAAAFAQLHAEFAGVVHGIALARVGAQQAEDLVQQVFLTVHAELPRLRDAAAFPGWLCAAARRRAVDVLRRQRRRPAAIPLPELACGDAGPPAAAEQEELRQRVLALLQRLPAAYRETLVLRFVEGLSGPEIAERTGMTHGSVRVNLTRGMARLRPLLAEAGLP